MRGLSMYVPMWLFLLCLQNYWLAQQSEYAPRTVAAALQPKELCDRYGDKLPAHALARLGTVRFQSRFPITSISLSPDTKVVAVGTSVGLIQLIDTTTGRVLRECKGHQRRVGALAFSSDGNYLASASRVTLRTWECSTGKQLATINNIFPPRILSLAFAPNGKCLAAGSHDGQLFYWNIAQGKTLPMPRQKHLTKADQRIFALAFSPDGKQLALGAWDGRSHTIRLLDRSTGKEIRHWRIQPEHITDIRTLVWYNITALVFSKDGRTIASASRDRAIRLWSAEHDKAIRRFEERRRIVQDIRFSRTGRIIAAGGGAATRICVWDVASGLETQHFQGHQTSVQTLAFSPRGKLLASGSVSGELILWDVKREKEVRRLWGHYGEVWSLCFSDDNKKLLSCADNCVILWAVGSGKKKRRLKTSGFVQLVALNGDKCFEIGDSEGVIQFWDIASGRMRAKFVTGKKDVYGMARSSDGRYWAMGGAEG